MKEANLPKETGELPVSKWKSCSKAIERGPEMNFLEKVQDVTTFKILIYIQQVSSQKKSQLGSKFAAKD